jgi:hypothetical protein
MSHAIPSQLQRVPQAVLSWGIANCDGDRDVCSAMKFIRLRHVTARLGQPDWCGNTPVNHLPCIPVLYRGGCMYTHTLLLVSSAVHAQCVSYRSARRRWGGAKWRRRTAFARLRGWALGGCASVGTCTDFSGARPSYNHTGGFLSPYSQVDTRDITHTAGITCTSAVNVLRLPCLHCAVSCTARGSPALI